MACGIFDCRREFAQRRPMKRFVKYTIAKFNMHNFYHLKEFYHDEFVRLLRSKGFRVETRYGQTLPITPSLHGAPLSMEVSSPNML